ncbi:MAG TPA: SBBP repeat-containing protein [Candidatus Sulfopaludibacter sp.]|nr:SBBP repeat-containing protein [Candidatus Sulfopaludibacter sp.]
MIPRVLILSLAAFAAQATEFSTFIGDTSDYRVARIQADTAGNTYIAGSRRADGGGAEVFVMKLDASGKIVLFNTLSGKGSDTVNDLAIDATGNVYVAGASTSVNLPLRNAFQSTPGPGFVVKVSPDLTQLVFSTYFPAAIRALAVDSSGGIYLTGTTYLPSFPVTPGLPAGTVRGPSSVGAASGAFLTKLSAAADRIVYSAVIVGTDKPCGCCSSCFLSYRNTGGTAIAVDPAGNAYMAGNTDTSNIPTTSGALLGTGTGAFVAKVNAAGTALVYLSYIGPTNYPLSPNTNPANSATSIVADAAGNAYVAGSTSDPKFPATTGAFQSTLAGPPAQTPLGPPSDAFVAKLNPTGSGVVWATYLGGEAADGANAIALDASGNVWIAGTTSSSDFPNAQGWSQGSDFVAELSSDGSKLPYCARYPDGAASQTLAVDGAGAIHIAGPAGLVSTLVPGGSPLMRVFGVANSAYGNIGGRTAPAELISIYGPHIGPSTAITAAPDSSGALPTVLGNVQVFGVQDGPPPAPIPLLYASDSQINAVVPYNLYGAYRLRIANGATSPDFPVTSLSAVPEIFQNGDGSAIAVNQDGSFNSAAHPAPVGSIVSIWATGTGYYFGGALPGQVATSARSFSCCTAALADAQAFVPYSGDTPGTIGGVMQINFQVPPLPPYGAFPGLLTGLAVSTGGATSHPSGIYVTP